MLFWIKKGRYKRPSRFGVFEIISSKYELVFFVTDVSCFSGIEYEVADGSNESIDAASDVAENEVSKGSGSIAFGFQRCVVDDKASDPTKEKCKKEANEFVVIHDKSP